MSEESFNSEPNWCSKCRSKRNLRCNKCSPVCFGHCPYCTVFGKRTHALSQDQCQSCAGTGEEILPCLSHSLERAGRDSETGADLQSLHFTDEWIKMDLAEWFCKKCKNQNFVRRICRFCGGDGRSDEQTRPFVSALPDYLPNDLRKLIQQFTGEECTSCHGIGIALVGTNKRFWEKRPTCTICCDEDKSSSRHHRACCQVCYLTSIGKGEYLCECDWANCRCDHGDVGTCKFCHGSGVVNYCYEYDEEELEEAFF